MSPSSTRTEKGTEGDGAGAGRATPEGAAKQSQCSETQPWQRKEKKNFLIAKSAKLRAKTENRTQCPLPRHPLPVGTQPAAQATSGPTLRWVFWPVWQSRQRQPKTTRR